MPQVNVSISEEVSDLLSTMAIATGMSKSSLIAEYVRRGLYEDVEKQERVTSFKKTISNNKPHKTITNGKKAYLLLAEKIKGKKLSDEEINFVIESLPEYGYSKADFD